MFNFLNNKTNEMLQKGSAALIVIGAFLIIAAAALGVFNGFAPKATVEVEVPQTKAEQKPPIKQVKTSFGAVNNLTNSILSLNNEIASRLITTEEKDSKLAVLTNTTKQRKILVKELMKENPRAFFVTAIKKDQRSSLPQNIQKDIEQETVITAKIEVMHIDDFKNPENSRFEYFLRTKDAKLNFYPTEEIYLISGAEVKINGFQLDEVVVSDTNKQNFQVTKEAPPLESVGDQKTLVLLINFSNYPSIPFTKEEAHNVIFNGQFQNFMKEQSYGKVSFSGDVLDWVTVEKEIGTIPMTACAQVDLDTPEIKNLLNRGINLNQYGRVLFVYNHPLLSGGCSNVGKGDLEFNNYIYRLSKAYIGVSDMSDIALEGVSFLLGHELGHSLGVVHANGWDCGEQIMHGDCEHMEYGNYFDVMGSGGYAKHFNAFYKELLGWVGPENSLLIDKTGRYAINPLETKGGINLGKIQVKDSTEIPFYLEYRQGIGFDFQLNDPFLSSNQSGLFINNIIKRENWLPFPRILDMNPTSLLWWEDNRQTTLNGQNIFTDQGSGITVGPIINTSTSSIVFDVAIGDRVCVHQKPQVKDYYYSNVNAGGSGHVQFDIINQDSAICEESRFDFVPILPSSWQYEIYSPENIANIFLIPGGWTWRNVQFFIPQDAALGGYFMKLDVINIKSGLKTSKENYINVLPPLVISTINPDKGIVGMEVTVSGSGFDYLNYISFYNQEGSAFMPNVVSDGNNLRFKIPSTIRKHDCNCDVPTAAGVYQVAVSTNSAQSNPVDFEVIESKPLPQLSITAPKNGDVIAPKSKITIATGVSDEIKDKTERVEFYVDGKKKCQDKSAPYSCNWTVPKKSGQTYELQAKAFGNKKLYGQKPLVESEIIKVRAEKSTNTKDDI